MVRRKISDPDKKVAELKQRKMHFHKKLTEIDEISQEIKSGTLWTYIKTTFDEMLSTIEIKLDNYIALTEREIINLLAQKQMILNVLSIENTESAKIGIQSKIEAIDKEIQNVTG